MIALLPLFTLFLLGDAAPSSILLEDMESFDFDVMVESLTSDTDELRQGPPPLPPLCPRSAQPNVTSVDYVIHACRYSLPPSLLRKGGKNPYIPVALNISAPNGTTECILKITSDGPGAMAFIVREFPEDAQMSLEDGVVGTKPFIRGGSPSNPVLVGVGRTSTTFKYSSASGGAIFINVFAVCFRGCHGKKTVEGGDTGLIEYQSKGLGARYQPICEYWFTAQPGRKVPLKFSRFNIGSNQVPCGNVRMVFAELGDKFFENKTYSACGQQKNLKVVIPSNGVYAAIVPKRKGKVSFQYSTV